MEKDIEKMNDRSTHWIGCTGKEYLKSEYSNHGKGGVYRGFKDLPKDEYPYTLKYEKNEPRS